MLFHNRRDAGRHLALQLSAYANRPDVLVLGLPRGGVPVAYEVARALNVPLDIFVVRKLGVPGQEELAMGAIGSGGIRVLHEEVVRSLGIPETSIDAVTALETRRLQQYERDYRGIRPFSSVRDRTVILVDDGLATGSSMRAAIAALRLENPGRVVAAVPVGARETCTELEKDADEVVCAQAPDAFVAVGNWYDDFSQTSDEEVRELLAQAQGGDVVPLHRL